MQLTIKSGQVIVVAPNGDGKSLTVQIYPKEGLMDAEFGFDMNIVDAHDFIRAIEWAVGFIPKSIR